MKDISLATMIDARRIMRKNFHPAAAINDFFDCNLNSNAHWLIPFSIEQLEKYKNNCILFPGCNVDKFYNPVTIDWFKKRFPHGRKLSFQKTIETYDKDDFMINTTCVHGRYYLIHKRIPDILLNGISIKDHPSRKLVKTEQKIETLKEDEQLENAVVYIFGMFLHYLITKEKMYQSHYVLCQDKGHDGRRVRVGYFEYLQAYVGCTWPETFPLGVAPSIKPVI